MSAALPTLFAAPATARAIEDSRALAILIGSYDGSGNYGDIAQLDAALELVARLGPGLLVVPVLERAYRGAHDALAEDALHRSAHVLFFDGRGAGEGGGDDGLVPVPAPADLAFAACYLYGGGYLNRSWGARKLAILRAAEALLAAGGAERVCRVSSGLQVDEGWIAELGPRDAEALRAFELLGVRDHGSIGALGPLGSASPVLQTGDDAVGVLGPWSARNGAAPSANGALHVNVHLVEHDWVTERPEALLGFYGDLLEALARRAGVPLVAHPLIAYQDERITEGPAVTRLAQACAARGIEVAEARVLRPARLSAAAVELRRADLTVSCSYHVALTSLMLGIPTLLIGDNPYYEQKAAGLSEAFELSPAFSVDATADPEATAHEMAGAVLDPERRALLQRQLAAGAEKLLRRRAEAEAELLSRLAAGALSALAVRIGELTGRLRERSAEPAELLAQLALLRSDHEDLERIAGVPSGARAARGGSDEARARAAADRETIANEVAGRIAAEDRAAEAEARCAATEQRLAVILASRSWAMTAPLRRMARRRHRAPASAE